MLTAIIPNSVPNTASTRSIIPIARQCASRFVFDWGVIQVIDLLAIRSARLDASLV